MAIQDVFVPDIGNFDSVDVIEVLVKAGDSIAKEDSLIKLLWIFHRPSQAWSKKLKLR